MKKSTIDAMKSMIEYNPTVQKYELGVLSDTNTVVTMYHVVNDKEVIFLLENSLTDDSNSMVSFDLTDDKLEEKFADFQKRYQLSSDDLMDSVLSFQPAETVDMDSND